jgi:hypothetical protein
LKKPLAAILTISFLILSTFYLPQTLALEMERPDDYIEVEERVESASTDGKAEVGIGVHCHEYYENSGEHDYNDVCALRIAATANTRKILEYRCSPSSYYWVDESQLPDENEIYLYDDQVRGLGTPFKIRFYGGAGSAEYDSIWVCSNGWLSFVDPNQNEPPPYQTNPESIPDSAGLNNFVAPLWCDLPWVKIKYGAVAYWPGYGPTVDCFVISWNFTGVVNQWIFQVLLECEGAGGNSPYEQSRIWFQYHTVTSLGDSLTVGIEDQGGWRGVAYNGELHSEMGIEFSEVYENNYARIMDITIKLGESENNAWTDIVEDSDWIRGHNINRNMSLPAQDDNLYFSTALAGSASLLIDLVELIPETVPPLISGVGFLIGPALLFVEFGEWGARHQAELGLVRPNEEDTNITAMAFEPNYNTEPVDADFCIKAFWLFNDSNTELHSLNVTAQITYEEFDVYGHHINYTKLSTSVELEVYPDNNNNLETANLLQRGIFHPMLFLGVRSDTTDFYKINIPQGTAFSIMASAYLRNRGIRPAFELYLYYPNESYTGISTSNGYNHSLRHIAEVEGDWIFEARRYDEKRGFYNLKVGLTGDVDDDGNVNAKDAVVFGTAFGSVSDSYGEYWHGPPCADCPYDWSVDLNNDGFVNAMDAVILGMNWGGEWHDGGTRESGFGQHLLRELSQEYPTTLKVQPIENVFDTATTNIGENFTISIIADNVTDLYGWEIKLTWAQGLINCTTETLNHDIWTYYQGPWVSNSINNENGEYWQSLTAKNPSPSFNGTTWLANLTFQIVQAPPEGGILSTDLTLSATSGLTYSLLNSSALEIPHNFVQGSYSYISPRYMRSDTHTINGLQAYKLDSSQSASYLQASVTETESNTVYWGIRVWKRSSAGSETEITSGAPVAQVSRSLSGYGIQSATWNCPNTTLTPTDSIVVRVYCMNGGDWTLQATFTTTQLNAQTADPTTWTVYYWTKRNYIPGGLGRTIGYFRWGTATHNSRIENFTVTPN